MAAQTPEPVTPGTNAPQRFIGIAKASFSLIPWLVLLLVVVSLPNLGLHTHLHPFDVKRMAELGFMALGLTLILLPPVSRSITTILEQLPRWARLGLSAIVLLGLVSSLTAEHARAALQEWATLVGLGLCTLLLAAAYREQARTIRAALAIALLLASGWYLLQFLVGLLAAVMEELAPAWPLPLFGFANVRFFAHYQLGLLPLLGWTVLYFRHPLLRSLAGALFVLWCSLLWYSLGRGAPLALITTMVLMAVILRGRSLRFLALMATGLLLGLLLAWLFLKFPQWIGASELRAPTGHVMSTEDPARLFLWQRALEFILEHPLLGIGPMHYAAVPNPIAAHPHDSLLQIGAEWGLPVLLLVLILATVGLWQWFRLLLSEPGPHLDPLRLAISLGLLSLGALSLVSGVIVMPLSQLLLTLLIALALGEWLVSKQSTGADTAATGTARVLTVSLALSALAVHAIVTWPQIAYRLGHADYVLAQPKAVHGPRFWVQGEVPGRP